MDDAPPPLPAHTPSPPPPASSPPPAASPRADGGLLKPPSMPALGVGTALLSSGSSLVHKMTGLLPSFASLDLAPFLSGSPVRGGTPPGNPFGAAPLPHAGTLAPTPSLAAFIDAEMAAWSASLAGGVGGPILTPLTAPSAGPPGRTRHKAAAAAPRAAAPLKQKPRAKPKSTAARRRASTAARREGPTSSFRGVTLHRRSGRYEAHVWVSAAHRQLFAGAWSTEAAAAAAFDLVVLATRPRGPDGALPATNFAGVEYAAMLPALEAGVDVDALVLSLREQASSGVEVPRVLV